MTAGLPETNPGLEWLDASGPHADIAIATRVRLARNLEGRRYGSLARAGDREQIFAEAAQAVYSACRPREAAVLDLVELPRRSQRILLERRLASQELIGGRAPEAGAGVAICPGGALSVMINEEDHLRMQCIRSGLRLADSLRRVSGLDDELGGMLPLAWHPEFGFLTSCPTNAGTGLRASVLLHLPGLVLTREITGTLRAITQVGLTTRGLFGEGSEFVGNFFQISNQTTLGRSEEDLVDHLDRTVLTVISREKEARKVLMRDAGTITEDKVWRAYGLLRYAHTIDYEEMMNLLSGVRLGVSLRILPAPSLYALNRTMILTQTAHLEAAAESAISPEERKVSRAARIRRILREKR